MTVLFSGVSPDKKVVIILFGIIAIVFIVGMICLTVESILTREPDKKTETEVETEERVEDRSH